jgi:hypothetical protein
MVQLIEYEEADPEVRALYEDIMAARQIDWVNGFQVDLDEAFQYGERQT